MGFGKIISPNRKTHDLYVVVEPDTVAAYRSNGLSFGYSFTGEQFENMTKEELTSYISENPIEVVYMLDTPITYSISPQTLRALRGLNNVFSDANGSVELTYWTH